MKFDKLFPWVKYEKFYKYAWTLGDIKNTYGWKDWEKEASVNSKIQSVTKGIDIFSHEGINRKLRECLVLGSIESIANKVVETIPYSLMSLINDVLLKNAYKKLKDGKTHGVPSPMLSKELKEGLISLRERINANFVNIGKNDSITCSLNSEAETVFFDVNDYVLIKPDWVRLFEASRSTSDALEEFNKLHFSEKNRIEKDYTIWDSTSTYSDSSITNLKYGIKYGQISEIIYDSILKKYQYKIKPLNTSESFLKEIKTKINSKQGNHDKDYKKIYDSIFEETVDKSDLFKIDNKLQTEYISYKGQSLATGITSKRWMVPIIIIPEYEKLLRQDRESALSKFKDKHQIGSLIELKFSGVENLELIEIFKNGKKENIPYDKEIPIKGKIINYTDDEVIKIEIESTLNQSSEYLYNNLCPPFYEVVKVGDGVCCKYKSSRKIKAATNVVSVLKLFDKWLLDEEQRKFLENEIALKILQEEDDEANEKKRLELIAQLRSQWKEDYKAKQIIADEITKLGAFGAQNKWIELHIQQFMMGAELYLKENFFRSEKQIKDLDEVGWFSNGSGGFINKLMGKAVRGTVEKGVVGIFYFLKHPKIVVFILKLILAVKKKICRELSIKMSIAQLQTPKTFDEKIVDKATFFGQYLHSAVLILSTKDIIHPFITKTVVMFKEFAGENAAAAFMSWTGVIKLAIEIAGICFMEAYEGVVYKQIIQEGYSNIIELLNPFECIKPVMIPDSAKIMTMTGDCDKPKKRMLRGSKRKNCEQKFKNNIPISGAVTDAVQEQIKREFKSGKWASRGSNLAVARENIVEGIYLANPDLDSNIKDVVRDEVDRQLLQQQFMGDVMKFNNMSMGTSSAQGFTPQLGNKDGLMKYVNWDLSAIKKMEKAQADWKETGTLESRWHNYLHPPPLGEDATFWQKAKSYIDIDEKYNLTGTQVESVQDKTNFIQHHIERLKKDTEISGKFAEHEKRRNAELISRLEDKLQQVKTSLREQSGGSLIDYKIDTLKKYLSGNISELDSIILQDLKK